MAAGIEATTMDVIDLCRRLNLECADLFHFFAESFKEDRSSLLLWRRLALEYENHSRKYALLAKYRRHEPLGAFLVDAVEAEVAVQYIKSIGRRARMILPSASEAIALGLELETKLKPFRIDNIIDFSDQSRASFFNALAQPHPETVSSLQQAYVGLARGPVHPSSPHP